MPLASNPRLWYRPTAGVFCVSTCKLRVTGLSKMPSTPSIKARPSPRPRASSRTNTLFTVFVSTSTSAVPRTREADHDFSSATTHTIFSRWIWSALMKDLEAPRSCAPSGNAVRRQSRIWGRSAGRHALRISTKAEEGWTKRADAMMHKRRDRRCRDETVILTKGFWM